MDEITVVVAEDEPVILRSTCRLIQDTDADLHVVATAMDGKEAFEKILLYDPDIVFTDVKMPVMDGLDMIEQTRKENLRSHFVLITGYERFDYARKAVSMGVNDYLLKPISIEKLTDCVTGLKTLIRRERQEQLIKSVSDFYDVEKNIFGASGDIEEEQIAKLPEKFRKYLNQHFTEDIAFGELDRVFGYNVKYLSSVFKDAYGVTPSKYVTDCRITLAKKLLRNDHEMMLKDVASAVGYEDALYFSRVFRNSTGLSPSQFQKQ
jgi:two-component system response regulator YesN